MLVIDADLPEMTASSAAFALRRDGDTLWLAYLLAGDESGYAIVRFDRVDHHTSGPPNDEGLHRHPLWGQGLGFYQFHRIADAPPGKIHWIATFHDETLDVVAVSCQVVAAGVNANDGEAALASMGENGGIETQSPDH